MAIVHDENSYKELYVKRYLKSYKQKKHILACLEHEKQSRRFRGNGLGALGASISLLPYQSLTDSQIDELITNLKEDLKNIEGIIQACEHGGLLKDLYINRLTWAQISIKWYMSEATISRTSRKTMRQLYNTLMELGVISKDAGIKKENSQTA